MKQEQSVLDSLKKALSAPAKKMDVPLVDECLKLVDTEYENQAFPNQDAVWTRIKANMNEKRGMSRNRKIAVVLLVVMAMMLLGAAIATSNRDIFHFIFDAGWDKSEGSVQQSAYKLHNENLLHLSLPHSDLDVLEAVYDGHELRVVYSLWWRDATAPLPTSSNSEYVDVSCFKEDGISEMCDWIEVNGQDAFFSDIYTVRGEKNGQALFYLQTNLFDWDIYPTEKLEIGLPLILTELTRNDYTFTIGQSTPESTFTIDFVKEEGLYFKAVPTEFETFDHFPIRLKMGYFSPVSAVIRLEVWDVDGTYDPMAFEKYFAIDEYTFKWGHAVLTDMDFNPLGITQLEGYGGTAKNEQGEALLAIHLSVTPPEKWPEQMQLVFRNEDDTLDRTRRIVFSITPDTL